MPRLSIAISLAALLSITMPSGATAGPITDVVESMAVAATLNREFKADCDSQFPELKDYVRKAFDAVAINSIVIEQLVDGREYRSPMLHAGIALKRAMTKGGQYGATTRSDCENPARFFERSLQEFSEGSDGRYYEELLNWAAGGLPATAGQQMRLVVDEQILQNLKDERFLSARPKEIRNLVGINLVSNVQLAQFTARAIKEHCDRRWPDRIAEHSNAYKAWPYDSIKAVTIVNGRIYENPYVSVIARQYWIPQIFGADNRAQEAACQNLAGTLEKVTRRGYLVWFPQLVELLTVQR